MIRVILWKELREQASILLALVMLGSGIVITAAVLGSLTSLADPFDFRSYSDPARVALIMLTMVGGLVCGSMLFANEHENGTADFLLYLPANRHRLWWAKFTAAITLTSVLSLLFSLVGLAVGIFPIQALLAWTLWLLILAVAAMASGMFGSSITKLVLAACGIGMLAGPMLANVGMFTLVFAARFINDSYGYFDREVYRPTFALAVGPLIAIGGMLMLSYVGFVQSDWRRKRTIRVGTVVSETKRIAAAIPKPVSRFGIRALAWLSHRQWGIPGIVLFSIATVFGLILAVPDVPMVFLWPAATSILAIIVGVSVFAPEQMSNVQRYWAEQRLPVGRLWTVKVIHAVVMLGSAMLLLGTPPLVTAIINKTFRSFSDIPSGYFRSMLIDGEGPVLAMVFLWPAYALVASLVAGQCFRKPVVSLAVGGMVGISLAALWIPSLLSGGLMHWQLWPAPIVALIGSRWLMSEWTRGQIASRSGLTKLTMIIVAMLMLVGGSIAYRWIEVPVVPEIEEDIAFARSIPAKDDKNAGQEVRRILGSFKPVYEELRKRPAMKFDKDRDRFRGSPLRTRTPPFTETVSMQLHLILKTGYPPDRPDFDDYFTELNKRLAITEDWTAIREKPTGVAFDPQDYNLIALLPELDDARQFFLTMATRGLREQALGRPDVFLDDVESLLAMARTMRSKTFSIVSLTMTSMEGYVIFAAIPRWLERLGHDPQRLARLQSILARHESEPPESPRTFHLAQMVTMRNSIRNPQGWYVKFETFGMSNKPRASKEQFETEANLLQFAWNVPWEKERLRRAFGLANAANSPPGWTLKNAYRRLAGQPPVPGKTPEEYIEGLPGLSTMIQLFTNGGSPNWLRDIAGPNRPEIDLRRLMNLRAAQTLVALRRFEAVRGQLPATLDELVPDYLPAVPIDPYSQKPFRYERSDGKERFVFLTELPESQPAPGTDIEPALERDEWDGIAAALGSIVQFPKPPEPIFPPGFDPNRGMEEGEAESLPALFGGLVHWPLGREPAEFPGGEGGPGAGGPGGPGDFIDLAKPIIIAGMGGVGAASLPWQVEQEAFGEETNPVVRFTANLQATPVPKGRGILWSVGNDYIDDQGMWQIGLGSNRGDVIWIVPSAAKK